MGWDKVNAPSHYGHGRIEVAVAMDIVGHPSQWLGHALKYACRAPHKGKEIEDLRKALWCHHHYIELVEYDNASAGWPRELAYSQLIAIKRALQSGIQCNGLSAELTEVRVQTCVLISDLLEGRWCPVSNKLAKALDEYEAVTPMVSPAVRRRMEPTLFIPGLPGTYSVSEKFVNVLVKDVVRGVRLQRTNGCDDGVVMVVSDVADVSGSLALVLPVADGWEPPLRANDGAWDAVRDADGTWRLVPPGDA